MKPILKGQFFKEVLTSEDAIIERGWTVIWVEPGTGDTPDAGNYVVIRNDTRTATPKWISGETLNALIQAGDWIETDAPIKQVLTLPMGDGSEKQERRKVSDEAEQARRLKLIQPILALGRDAFLERPRSEAMKAIANDSKISVVCVWQYLTQYWQMGLRPEGLLPRRRLTGQKPLEARIRMSAHSGAQLPFKPFKPGRKPTPESEPGIAMTFRDLNLCRKGARKFLFQPSPDHRLTYRWTYAHLQTLNVFYGRDRNPAAPAPTLRQFKQAVCGDHEFSKLSQRIIGALPFARNHRELKGTTRADLTGPGQETYLDDMVTKVILVDAVRRLPLGTARVFFLVDVWSKLITGAHDTLNGSSYAEAIECLYNAYRDKAAFSEEQRLDLDLEFLPAYGVPAGLTTDNGPLHGALASTVAINLADVSNATSYRPDLKGDVESSFHAYLVQHARCLPGYNRADRTRGDDDPKILAYLTPREFRTLLWKWIALYNQRPLEGFLPAYVLAAENPPRPTPYELWNWGIDHCGGHLEYRTDQELRLKFLSADTATMTSRRGIKYRGLVYHLVEAKEGESGALLQSVKVSIRYDHKFIRRIFVCTEEGLKVAALRSDLDEEFGSLTFAEVDRIKGKLDQARREIRTDYRRKQGQLLAENTKLAAAAKEQTDAKFLNERQRKQIIRNASIDRIRATAKAEESKEHSKKVEALFTPPAPPTAPSDSKPPTQPTKPRVLSAQELLNS